MDGGATDSTVTELLTGIDFHDVKNGTCRQDGFVKPYRNGYNRVRICRLCVGKSIVYLPLSLTEIFREWFTS